MTALRDTIEVCDENEIEGIALELITLAGPIEYTNHKLNIHFLDRLTALIQARRESGHRAIAHEAQVALMGSWARLPETCRRLALAIEHAPWAALAAESIRSYPSTVASVADFIETRDDADLLGVAVELLTAREREIADTAEAVVLRFAARVLPTPEADLPRRAHLTPAPGAAPAMDDLVRSLALALDRIESHERSGPALAALLLLDRPANDSASPRLDPLRTIIADEHHPAFPVVRRLLRRDDSPATRRIAWRLLGDHPLAMAALERIARSGSSDQHNALLEHDHLLLHPKRRDLVTHLSTSSPAKPNARDSARDSALPRTTKGLSVRARRGLPRLLSAAKAHTGLRASLHVEALADPDVPARLSHARHTTGPELADFCFDPSPEVALAATLRWSSVGVSSSRSHADPPAFHRARFAGRLAHSPHEAVRLVARAEPTQDHLDTGTPSGRARLLASLSRDRVSLNEQLRAAASTGSIAERVEAIRVARRLHLLGDWLGTLTGLIDAPPDRAAAHVAATAAAALGDLPGDIPSAGGLLDRAMAHPDPRVSANAIESVDRRIRLGRGDMGMGPRLVEFKHAPEHRARANALRALSRRGDGRTDLDATGDDLARMLTDDRSPHRLAGVWLSERLLCGGGDRTDQWQGLARRIASLARDESDAHIKARALRCSRRLLGELAKPARESPRLDPALEHAKDRLTQYAAAHSGGHDGGHAGGQA